MEPITRIEKYLSYIDGNRRLNLPEPLTRLEKYLYSIAMNGTSGGGGGTLNHNDLLNRDAENQHPIKAINGLQLELDKIKEYSEGDGINIKEDNSINVELPTVEISKSEYDALSDEEKNKNILYIIKDDEMEPIYIDGTGCPIGTIIALMGKTVPDGYLGCNGDIYNISEYPELSKYFLDQFGAYNYFGGDGTTTFAVPDLRGEFLRGTGTNSHETSGNGSSVGTHQTATTIPRILLSEYNNISTVGEDKEYLNVYNADYLIKKTGHNRYTKLTLSDTTYYNNTQSFSTRPTNTSVLYCIRAVSFIGSEFNTDEIRIGTWIDGKPLYRKVYNISATGTQFNSDQSIADISDINYSEIISISGVGLLTNGGFLSINSSTSDQHIFIAVLNNNILINTQMHTGTGCVSLIVILEYTKTTD